jgi:hypothetical protein
LGCASSYRDDGSDPKRDWVLGWATSIIYVTGALLIYSAHHIGPLKLFVHIDISASGEARDFDQVDPSVDQHFNQLAVSHL